MGRVAPYHAAAVVENVKSVTLPAAPGSSGENRAKPAFPLWRRPGRRKFRRKFLPPRRLCLFPDLRVEFYN